MSEHEENKPVITPGIDSFKDLSSLASDFPELVKSRLTALVLITTGAGFCLGWQSESSLWNLFHVLLGTAGVAAGAAVLNELLEVGPDGKMKRTQERPLPAGRINPQDALFIGGILSGLGLAYLSMVVNSLSALLAGITWGIYLFIYTPMKRVSSWNTLVGAIPGALPPTIGWAAAAGSINSEATLFFLLQFCWQMPHFLAIAWLYREDYDRGGFRMITATDAQGKKTALYSLIHTASILPLTVATFYYGEASWIFLIGGLVFAVIYLLPAVRFWRAPDNTTAKPLFLTSLLYLPGLFMVAILDRAIF
ncbi:MAG: heme o synthase [Verrucomicrobiota bacterium]